MKTKTIEHLRVGTPQGDAGSHRLASNRCAHPFPLLILKIRFV